MPKTEVEAEKILTKLHQEALQHIPVGMNSSTRALDPPIVWGRAQGSKLFSVDGKEYLNYHAAFGPILLGHNHPIVNRAMAESLEGPDLAGVGRVYDKLFHAGAGVARELTSLIERYRLKAHVAHFGSVFVMYFMEPPVESYTDLLRNDAAMDVKFRRGMVERDIFLMPLALKRNHLGAAHTEQDIALTLETAEDVFRTLSRN
jgi:glutamate-1-semialdehyde aminotransferase